MSLMICMLKQDEKSLDKGTSMPHLLFIPQSQKTGSRAVLTQVHKFFFYPTM
jgi:hypothetical protein